MNKFRFIEKALKNQVSVEATMIAILSDLHLGTGRGNDNSLKNNLYLKTALTYYLNEGYHLILVGDTFELAENKSIEDIKVVHEDIMRLLKEFDIRERLTIIKGNHDQYLTRKMLETRIDSHTKKVVPFLKNYKLVDSVQFNDYLILHGHQDSACFSTGWNRVINFGLRFGWSFLERWAFKDPTSEATGFNSAGKTDKLFMEYADKTHNHIIIGHTHSVQMQKNYTNIGAGVMPRCITCVEIVGGFLNNYKWSTVVEGNVLTIQRSQLG